MKNEFLEKIIKERRPCYFISPHLDDAALSAGGLMTYLRGKVPVKVINVFTKGDNLNTLSASKFLKITGFRNAAELYKARLAEDKDAMDSIGVEVINMNFTDALWRKRKTGKLFNFFGKYIAELISLYPTYKLHITKGKLVKNDDILVNKLARNLRSVIKDKKAVVICPLGVGNHVDHILVKKACQKAFAKSIFWMDFPYFLNEKNIKNYVPMGSSTFTFNYDKGAKRQLIRKYLSQTGGLFPTGKIKLYKERFVIEICEYSIKQYGVLDDGLEKEWSNLWKTSPYSHFFNSPVWFKTVLKTFNYKNVSIYVLEKSGNKVAIWPLIKSGKYLVPCLQSPGSFYVDKNSILLKDYNPDYVNILISYLKKNENIYIQELSHGISRLINQGENNYKKLVSFSPYLPLHPYALRFTSDWQIEKLEKILKREGGKIRIKIRKKLTPKVLREIRLIDLESSKFKSGIEVFSNSASKTLYTNLSDTSPKSIIIAVLYYAGKPIAFYTGCIYNNVFYACDTSYNSNFSNLSPGKLLVYHALNYLPGKGIKMLEFSRGLTGAKRDFTPLYNSQYDILVTENFFLRHLWKLLSDIYYILKENEKIYILYCNVRYVVKKLNQINLTLIINKISRSIPNYRINISKEKLGTKSKL